jgi:hypothetical protein
VALVNTGLFGTKSTFVPLAQANPAGDDAQIPYEKQPIKDAQHGSGRSSVRGRGAVVAPYGLDYGAGYTETAAQVRDTEDVDLPAGVGGREAGCDTTDRATAEAMTRSEEGCGTTAAALGRQAAGRSRWLVHQNAVRATPLRCKSNPQGDRAAADRSRNFTFMGSDYPLTRSSIINIVSSHVQTGVVRVEEEGEQLGKVSALSDRSISTWWRGTVALAQPMASHYESQAAGTRNRGFRPLCEPAGGVWRWWWRRLWRRRRADHDSYDRHNHDRHNYDKYDRHDNYDDVGRSARAVKHLAQGNRSAWPGLDRGGELAEACSHAVLQRFAVVGECCGLCSPA